MGSVYKHLQLSNVAGQSHSFPTVAFTRILSLLSIIFLPLCAASVPECVQRTPCSCVYSDGSAYIDLSPVSRSDGKPFFSDVQISNEEGGLVMYNPCSSFNVPGADSCKNVSVCHENKTESTYNGIGNLSNVSFEIDHRKRQYYLSYTSQIQENSTVQTFVYLICTEKEESSKLTAMYNGSDQYNLHLSSRYACVISSQEVTRSLSVGTWLCILFASITLGYFGTGVLYKRVAQNASGTAALPHHDFWMEFPSLVKDGYIFFISPCLGNDARYHAYRYEPL